MPAVMTRSSRRRKSSGARLEHCPFRRDARRSGAIRRRASRSGRHVTLRHPLAPGATSFPKGNCVLISRFLNFPSRRSAPGGDPEMADRRRQLAFRGLIFTAAALIALAVLATVLTIIGLHDDAMQDAERDAGNLATVLAEQTAHSVRGIDVALIELQGKVAASGIATPE